MRRIDCGVKKTIESFGQKEMGLPTGLKSLDNSLRGLLPAHLIVIAGRSSMGKSSIMLDMALHIGKENPCLIVSLEMPFQELQERAICNIAKLNYHRILSGFYDLDTQAQLNEAAKVLEKRKVFVADGTWQVYPDWFKDKDTGKSPTDSLISMIREVVPKKKIKAIFIDHLQFLNSPFAKADNESIRLHKITEALHFLSIELNIPIVLLSQLRRLDPERKKNNPRPSMDDIRNSGSVEEDANVVCLLHRPEYYKREQQIDLLSNQVENDAEIIVSKNRGGPCGTLKVKFSSYCMSFEDCEDLF